MRGEVSSDPSKHHTPSANAEAAAQSFRNSDSDRSRVHSKQRQHAEPHSKSQKSSKTASPSAGAKEAAEVQGKATHHVQQLAQPEDDFKIAEAGVLATTAKRQKDYNKDMQSKPWAAKLADESNLGAGPTGTGNPAGRSRDWLSPRADQNPDNMNSEVQTQNDLMSCSTSDDPAPATAAQNKQSSSQEYSNCSADKVHEIDHRSEQASERPQQEDSSSKGRHSTRDQSKSKGSSQDKGSKSKAVRDTLKNELTQQHHQQNNPKESESLPPVVKKLHKAQQRAHNEMEAAEKQANQLRFQEEAGQRFVSSARKHKSELDSTIYEHGREIRLRSTHD